MKTLITGGKSSQALKLLKAFPGTQVLLADYGETPAFSSPTYQFVGLGERNDETIAHNLLNICLDQDVQQLLPLYTFELEAVIKSAILFEEFDIHVLLPDMNSFSGYLLQTPGNLQHWAVYIKGEQVYASVPELKNNGIAGLNGVFYMEKQANEFKHTLFTIS